MRLEKHDVMSKAISDRLRSPTWATDMQQKVETVKRRRSQSRARLLIALTFFGVAGWLTTDDMIEEDSSRDNIYAMVEDVTLTAFPGQLIE